VAVAQALQAVALREAELAHQVQVSVALELLPAQAEDNHRPSSSGFW